MLCRLLFALRLVVPKFRLGIEDSTGLLAFSLKVLAPVMKG